MNHLHHRAQRARQQGITLIIGMIMLVLATLLVLATFHLGKSNLEIVGNVQHRIEALGAAQQTIDAAVSSERLTSKPADVFQGGCYGANTRCYDVNDDKINDIVVTLVPDPTCVKAETVKVKNLDKDIPSLDLCRRDCGDLIEGAPSCDSLCSSSLWDIRAEAQDSASRTTAVINQGVATIVATTDLAKACP